MDKLMIAIGMTVGSTIGWWLGGYEGPYTEILLSTAFGILGIIVGWKLFRAFFE